VEREELKKLNIKRLAEITKLIFRIDTLLEDVSHGGEIITIHDTIYKDKDINAIVLPFSFTKKDEWMSLGGDFDNTGKLGIALKMQADVNVYTGITKKTKEPFCVVTSPNPYLNVINVQSYKTDTYKPRTFSVAVQLGYGLILAKDPQISPYVGIGISRNLISF
jgi:hypothetical protein